MTKDELEKKFVAKFCAGSLYDGSMVFRQYSSAPEVLEWIDSKLQEAVLEERKACIEAVMNYETDSWNHGMLERIAEAIESRKGLIT
jgi:hypothetical protein